jgi:hypothetical protein
VRLKGFCNRCGLCCTEEKDGVTYRCLNLIVRGPLAAPSASMCGVYDQRRYGMAITMVSAAGKTLGGNFVCIHGGAEEPEHMAQFIGRGCSYEVDNG